MSIATNVLRFDIPVQVDLRITPNAKYGVHWGTKTRLRNELKDTAWMATLAAINDHKGPVPAIPLVMHLTVYRGKGRRPMDDDNIIAWAKPMRDAIAATLGVDDKHITTGEVSQAKDPDGVGFVVVRLEHEA